MRRRYIVGMRREDGHATCSVTRMANGAPEARILAELDHPGWKAGEAKPMFTKGDKK